MSESLSDSAEMHLQNALSLMQNGESIEALKELEKAEEAAKLLLKDPENEFFQTNLQIKFNDVFKLGYLLVYMGRFSQARDFYELSLLISQKLLHTDPDNVAYQSYVGGTLNNLGALLSDMGRLEDAKNRYEKALDMRQKLLHTDPDNVAYQSYVGTTLNNLGTLLSDTGRVEDAKNMYEKALDIYEKLLQTDPDNVAYQSDVAMTLNNLGVLHKNMGRIEDAKNRYENALIIYEKLLLIDPDNITYQSDVAMVLNNLGTLLKNMGRIEDAKNRYENALDIYEKLLLIDPDNVAYQSDVAMTLNNLGTLLKNMGRIEDAKNRYENAFDIYEKLLLIDPDNVAYQSYVGTTLNNLGVLLKNMGCIEDAKNRYENALDMRQKLLLIDPDNVAYQSDVAMTLNNLGTLLSDMGRIEDAKNRYENAFDIYEKLLLTDPDNVVYQSDVAMTLNNLGTLLWTMGRIEYAKNQYENALDMRQKLLLIDPDNITYQSDVAMTLNNLGTLLSDMGRIEDAKNRYENALDMRQKLLLIDPDNVAYQSDVAMTLNNLGTLLSDMGRIEDAKNRYENALVIYKKLLLIDPDNVAYQSYVGGNLNNLGTLLLDMGRIEDAKNRYENALVIYKKLLLIDPDNVAYQSYVGTTLNNLGTSLWTMDRIEDAKNRYEKALDMRQKLLQSDPDNVVYQSYVGTTLNNLGTLLLSMGRVEDAKEMYEKTLKIFTEPMQYLTIGRKSQAIIKIIELNLDLADKETNDLKQMGYLKESYKLCKENQDFLVTYGLRHERKLVMEAGFSAYVEYVMKNVRWERDSKKRAIGYEKAIKAIEKLGKIGDDEEVDNIASSAVCYLEGRKLVNEALGSEQPDFELIKQAVNQFKDAKETYKKANVCYCIYIGLLKILENVELFEEKNGSKAKNLIQQVIEILPEKIDPGIRAAFEEIAKIFDEKDIKSRKKHLEEFDGKIRAIEYKALENLFGHVQKKLKDYIEEPFSPNLFYNNWKLKITLDAENIKGKLTIKAGNTILFDRALSKEEIKDNAIEIDYLERKYVPDGEDVLIFETPSQKPVVRDFDYSETISANKKARIFLHNLGKGCARWNLKIAAVQLRYDVYIEDSIVKILGSRAYKRKIMAILEEVKEEADIVVFPEFSIPFDYLKDIQKYVNENGIIVFAGTHYITEKNVEEYENLFASDFSEEDFRKNVCPVITSNSNIMHSEKMFGAKEERALFSNNGMKQGKQNHIFRLWDNLNIGVLICFEYLNDELRHRLIPACDVILVPQTNPSPERFYNTAKNDLNNPLCAGNKAYIMANGIFRIRKMENGKFVKAKKEIYGGSSGVVLTLDKDSNRMLEKGIYPQKEQFVLLATINLQYSAARDIQIAPEPIKISVVHIFEKKEIRLIKKEDAEGFLALLENINDCKSRKELKSMIEENRSLIEKFSPHMHKCTEKLNNLDFEEVKEKCRFILINDN